MTMKRMNLILRALGLAALTMAWPAAMMADVPVVPELNPGTAGSTVAMLAGAVLMLRSRKRR